MMFLDCPARLDTEGSMRCGLPAEVRCRFTIRSSDGPLEAAMIRCPSGHWFNGSIESLTGGREGRHDSRAAAAMTDVGSGRGAVRLSSPEPDQHIRRPNGAPAYYLGRPASLYLTALTALQRQHTPMPDEYPGRQPGAHGIAAQ